MVSNSIQQTDTPGGAYTPAQIRHGLRNILVAFAFDNAFLAITTGAVFSAFLTRHLQVSDVWYGLILAATQATVFLQYIGSLNAERTGLLKPKYMTHCTPQRLLWLGVAAVPLVLAHAPTLWKALAVAVCVLAAQTLFHLGKGGTLAWLSGMVPRSAAGHYFGYRQRMGMIATLVVSIGVAVLIDHFPRQDMAYALVFTLAAAFGIVDILLLRTVAEIRQPEAEQPPTLRDIITGPWRNDAFRHYAPFLMCNVIVTSMLDPFVWRYCLEQRGKAGLEMQVTMVSILLFILPTLIMAWLAPSWGKMIDRYGPRPVLNACMVGLILAPLAWLVMQPELTWLIPFPAILSGVCTAGMTQVETYMRVKGFPEQWRTSYLASLNVANGTAIMAGAALGGVLATFWAGQLAEVTVIPAWVSHYHPMFLTAILLRVLLFFGVRRFLHLPGSGKGSTVVREMLGEAVSNIPGVRV